MNLDERLEQIRAKIAMNNRWRPDPDNNPGALPPRSPDLEGRVEYVLNAYELEKMELVEVGRTNRPQDVNWIALEHLSAAIKPAELSWCERTTIHAKRRLRLIAEWIFRIAR